VSPTEFHYAGTGSTNTFTFTGVPAGGLGYEIPPGVDWVTVSNLTNESVDITTSESELTTDRTTTVKICSSIDVSNYVEITIYQASGQDSMVVSKTSITYMPTGGTEGFEVTWTDGYEPTATVSYVQGDGDWMIAGSTTVTDNVKSFTFRADPNYTGSSRTALIIVTNGLQTEQIAVSQSSSVRSSYISWSPYISTGSFSINSSYYNFSSYQSCYFSDFLGTITSSAFYNKFRLSTIETNAAKIEDNAFALCNNITQASLSYCSYIGEYAFKSCTKLSNLYLPECVCLSYGAFVNCSSLTRVELSECRTVGTDVFTNCWNISLVSLPECRLISRYAFYECLSLTTIYLDRNSVCQLSSSNAFDGTQITSSTGSILVPSAIVSAYQSAYGWSYFSDRIFPIPV
jgi:hypothetical protein